MTEIAMQRAPRIVADRSLAALALLNFFLADARDGLGPFLDGFLATNGWSPFTLGWIATIGGLVGLLVTPICGAIVDGTTWKRAMIAVPVALVTAAAVLTIVAPTDAIVWGGQIVTAVVGAIIGPALAGLTLGLVGERLFSQQLARNEFWNHAGNFASLFAIFVAVSMFGQQGVTALMLFTAVAAIAAVLAIRPDRIDHAVARGLSSEPSDDASAQPSGYAVLLKSPGLLVLAGILLVFHFANAPMTRLMAQEFSIQLGTPFRTTAIVVGVAQFTMIVVAALTPFLIRRLGVTAVFAIALAALPLRGFLAGQFHDFWVIYPVQALDGIGAGLLGILTPVLVERHLVGTGRFNVGFAAVMMIQGIGASLSNVFAGYLVDAGDYRTSHYAGAAIAAAALLAFVLTRRSIVPPGAEPGSRRSSA